MNRFLRWLCLGFLLAAVGCGGNAELPLVSLEPPLRPQAARPGREPEAVRIGAAPIFSPVPGFEQFSPLVAYLASVLERPVAFVQRSSYAEVNEMVRTGALDCAITCSGAFVFDDQGLDALVVPVIDGDPRYRAVCVVPAGSEAKKLEDLRNASVAVTDPLSFTGRAYLFARALQLGAPAEEFFARVIQVEGHDALLDLVAGGTVGGGCVNSMVMEGLLRQMPDLASQLRVVERSEPFGAPPVIVSEGLDPALRASLRAAFEQMSGDPEGLRILNDLGVDRFEVPAPGLYADLAEFLGAGGDSGGSR